MTVQNSTYNNRNGYKTWKQHRPGKNPQQSEQTRKCTYNDIQDGLSGLNKGFFNIEVLVLPVIMIKFTFSDNSPVKIFLS